MEKLNLKICIIGPGLKMGGVEGASCTMANNLSAKGNDVIYIALMDFNPFFKLDDRVQYLTPDFKNLPKMSFFKTVFWIRKQINSLQPESIIVYTKYYAALVNIALLFCPFKIVVSERSSPFYIWPLHIAIFGKISFFLKKPAGVIAQTEIARKIQQKTYGYKIPIAVIPNAVRPMYPDLEAVRENVIIAIGRFNDSCKGFDLLLKAFSIMDNKTWILRFIGGSKDEGGLSQIAEELKISDRVQFLGKAQNINHFLNSASIFVIPSRSEGFPNVLVEAMACGLACISFDFHAGPRDIITHDHDGILVPAGDVKGLAKAMDELILDSNKRFHLSKNALKINNRLNPDRITKMTQEFLYKLYNFNVRNSRNYS